ncbi:MAG: hypothetical protein BIFFINMI_02009 [Phycisphaerae bacterium]|nr:hypothetical protein [Phycisphaerae bacterium]
MASSGAIKAGQAFVELLADSSKLEKGLRAASAKLRAWGTSIRSFGRKMAGVGVAIAGPLAGTGKVFGDFEQQMKMVSTMLDEPEKHMDRFSAGIRKLSVQFGEGTDVLAKGLYDLLSASVDPAQALGVLETAVKAAKGGMTDTSVAVDGLTSVLNAFQMSADQAGRVSDTMFAAVKRGKLTFPELAANIGKVAPMARAAGMSMEDMMAAIATMTRQGLSAEEASTRLVNILKNAPEAAGNLGALVAKYAGKSLSEIQVDFPEVRAAGGIAALAADLTGFSKDVQLMRDSAGQADVAFAKMTGGISEEFKKVKMAVLDVMVSLGGALAPTLKAFGQWVSRVASHVGGWVQANRSLVVTILKVAAAVAAGGVVLMGLGRILGGLSSMFSVFAAIVPIVSSVLGAVGGVLMWLVSPIGLVIGAVAALGIYFAYSTGQIGKATSWLAEGWNILKDDALTAFGGISDALAAGNIGLAAQVLWALLKLEWARGTGWLSNVWNRSMNFLVKVLTEAWAGLKIIAYAVWHGLEVAWIETTAFLADAWYWFVGIFMRSWESMKAWAKKAWVWIKKLFGKESESSANEAYRQIDAERDAAVRQIKDETARKRADRELARQRQREQSGREFDQTVQGIVTEQDARERAMDAEQAARERANQADVAAAKKRLSDLAGQAKEERKAKERAGPEGMKSPEEVVGKLKNALAGMGDQLDLAGKAKTEAHGTFNAAAILGLQAGGHQERIAKATEKTATNTDKLLNRANTGALTFV